MDMKLEVVVLPVSDVERAKRFYEKLGFRLDVDVAPNENYRAVHLTPPGSEASILFGKGVTSAQPGSIDRLLLAVYDIGAARQELLSKGVDVSEVFHDAGAASVAGLSQVLRRAPLVRIPNGAPMSRMPRSAILTATFGCCRKSRSGCLEERTAYRSTEI